MTTISADSQRNVAGYIFLIGAILITPPVLLIRSIPSFIAFFACACYIASSVMHLLLAAKDSDRTHPVAHKLLTVISISGAIVIFLGKFTR